MRCASCYAELPHDSDKCPKCSAVAKRAPGERRQITALFCDIVGSTQLATGVEVEVYTEALNAFHRACAQIVVSQGGHLAQYLGDGVLAYFGHPTAHEDDPRRAVRAALEILETIPKLKLPAELGPRAELGVRVGIDTGLVVVGAGPSGLATGQTPNCAYRVQELAVPNTVFITGETHKLVAAQFDCVSAGTRALKGFSPAIMLYRVLAERLAREASATLTPFVGRQRELDVLLAAWRAVAAGEAQSFIVVGDAGLGKTRLVERFIESATAADGVRVLRGQGSPYHQHTAFYPLIQVLAQLTGQTSQMSAEARGSALSHWLEENALDRREIPAIVQLLGHGSPSESLPALDPGRRGQIIENAKRVFSRAAERAPFVLSMEDLHWVDPSTLDVLSALRELKSVLLIGTCRPIELSAWADASRFPKLELDRLTEPDVDAIVRWIARGSLQGALLEAVVRTTDGVPLFVEEQTRMLLESAGESDRPHTIAPSLQASLLARLDRLGDAKRVVQFAAVVGRAVPRALLTAGSELAGSDFEAALERLTSAGLLRQVEQASSGMREERDASLADSGGLGGTSAGVTYVFKHALVQEAAYQSLLKSDRRRFHAIVAERLEQDGLASAALNPEILAHHHGHARAFAKSARYGLAAARRAMDAGGYREAREHIENAVVRLAELPDDTETRELELELRLLEGFCLISAMGYGAPSVHQAFARAKELVTGAPRHSGEAGDPMRTFSVLWGVWSFFVVLPDFAQASVLGAEMARLAHESDDRNLALELGVVLGMPALWGGQLETARRHFESTLELGASSAVGTLRFNQDPVVVAGAHLCWIYWLQGDPAKAKAASESAIARAQRIGHPYSESYARAYGSVLSYFLRDPVAAKENAAELEVLADKYGFPTWKAVGSMIRGWALSCDGEAASALPLVEESFNLWELVGVGLNRPARIAIRAEVKARAGNAIGALADVEEALAMGALNGDRYYEAELTRLRGEFSLLGDPGAAARAAREFESAILIASGQGASVLVDRAATSARELLAVAPSSGVAPVPETAREPVLESGVSRRADLESALSPARCTEGGAS